MKKIATLVAASAAMIGATVASAATFAPSPSGPHVFQGSVAVQKDGLVYTCTLTVNANVTSPTTATATASLSGAFPCALISVTGTGNITHDGTDWGISGLTIDPPLSPGLCNGRIKFAWGGNTGTRTITVSSPYSDSSATSGAPCKLVGVLTNTSPVPNTLTLVP
ncbi:MAG: hypothetical protein HEQ22_05265 [Sphingopyxis sp.]|uniref:hypothetical protein n=1 Tax=Sphingopyxis sp. TaxID=1908224 RepID=UPI003D80FF9E